MDMSKALAANMYSANCNSAMINDLQQLGFALQSNLLKSDSASYCARCDPEIRRLEAQLHESLANQDALETELRWALESKLAAELSLAEHLTHTRSLIDSLGNATPRGPLGWMPATSPPDQDEDSLSLFSQPLISSPMKVDHRHENGKHCDEVTKELEMQLARMSYQFQTLAECYSLTAHRLQQAQNEVYKLNLENLELQAANGELIKGYRLKERQLQQILLDRTALAMPGTEFNMSALPLSYGNTPLMCEQTFSHVSSPELKQGVCHSDAADNAPSKVGPGAYSGARAREHQDQTTSLSQLSIADNSTAADTSTLPPATLQHGRVLSERTNISNLVIPKRDLKTWYLPSKFPSRDHQQFDSPGAASACAMKANAESAPTVATLPARPLCEDLTQSTDCTVVLDTDPLILNSKSATISEGSGSKVHGSVMLPKSISIRASGTSVVTVMANLSCQTKKKRSVSPESTDSLQSLVLSPVSPLRPHRLRLSPLMGREELLTSDSAGKEGSDNDQVECDVFDQGMYKTELCNKWQEGGHCPYGNRCQFAHGVDELRPVLRHPRYKTELCRMVANGDKCPYGHRCHFRHSMTKEERASLL